MARRTRSIVLVLLGTAAAGCGRRPSTPLPAEPDDAAVGPSTRPVYGDGSTPPYGYGPLVHARHPGLGWIGGTAFDPGRRYGWEYGSPWGRPYVTRYRSRPATPYSGGGGTSAFSGSSSHFNQGEESSPSHSSGVGHGTTFGGFGEHASGGHGGS